MGNNKDKIKKVLLEYYWCDTSITMPIKLKTEKELKRLTKTNPCLVLTKKEAISLFDYINNLSLTEKKLFPPQLRKKLLEFRADYIPVNTKN